jgi:hypothetical protein
VEGENNKNGELETSVREKKEKVRNRNGGEVKEH